MKENKRIIITSIIVAICVIATLGATYAYFQAVIGTGSSTSTTIKAQTIDGLTFDQGTDLSITATQTNFASGSGDLTSDSNPYVMLKARNDAATSYSYKACLNITENTFVHSQVSTTDHGLGTIPKLLDITQIKNFTEDDYKITLEHSQEIGILRELCPNCKAGRSYAIFDDKNNNNRKITLTSSDNPIWSFAYANAIYTGWMNAKTLTERDLNSPVLLDAGTYEGLQIVDAENSPTYTKYEPGGGYVAGAELSISIMSKGKTLLEKDISGVTGEICVPTTQGGTDYTHIISANAGSTNLDNWYVRITLHNYSDNQNINQDKSFKAKFNFTRV